MLSGLIKNVSLSTCPTQLSRVRAIDYGLKKNISEKNLQMLLDISQNTEMLDVVGFRTYNEDILELSCYLYSIHR